MTGRMRRLTATGVGVALAGLGWTTIGGSAAHAPARNDRVEAVVSASPRHATPIDLSVRSYALRADELAGLPLDAPPGTRLDLWVAWDPPITKRPKVHLLLRGVVLEEISPPVTPDGPFAAILGVKEPDIADLIYADRYGSLSVALSTPD